MVEVAAAGRGQASKSWPTRAVTGRGTPFALAVARAMPRSLRCRSMRKPGAKLCSIIVAPLISITRLAASPPESTWTIFSGSTPALRAEHERLADRRVVDRDDDLVAGLDDLPRARAADVDDRLAHRLEERHGALEIGRVAADHDAESVPAIAPLSPPLTGASSARAPALGSASLTSIAVAGAIVLMSIRSCRRRIASSKPVRRRRRRRGRRANRAAS